MNRQSESEAHPENLLMVDGQDHLSDEQRQAIMLHVEKCAACAALALTRTAFARELAARPTDAQLDLLAADQALAALASQGRTRGHRRKIWRWAAATLPLAALAAASPWLGHQSPKRTNVQPQYNEVAAPRRGIAVLPLDKTAPPPSAEEPSAPPRALNLKREAVKIASPAMGDSAPELFRQAAELHQQGARAKALAMFRKLQGRYPESPEARLSYVIAGRLLLEAGQNAAAASAFNQYLAGSGPAEEEALVGRATALNRMGRFGEERSVWTALLQRFPESVQARRATQRIRELENR